MKHEIPAPGSPLAEVVYSWEKAGNASLLRQTQLADPAAWQRFYSQIADVWEAMTGSSHSGRDLVDHMAAHSMIRRGDRVLDLGCGAGRLALALADRGIRVTALDNNPEMIGKIQNSVEADNIKGVTTELRDWADFRPDSPYSLAAACFFPDVLSPGGIRRFESLSRDRCLLVLGDGSEAFPLRRRLWEKIMDEPLPSGGFHLKMLTEYLNLSGRNPLIVKIARPACLNVSFDVAKDYFRSYFAIFGKTGYAENRMIRDTLAGYAKDGSIRIDGISTTAIAFWSRKSSARFCAGAVNE